MTNQPNEAAKRYTLEMIRMGDGCSREEMSYRDDGAWVKYDDHARIASSLRSALANAEKQIEEREHWRTQHGAAYQQVADARDAALTKLAEAEKRADSLQLETNCARNERDSAIDDWGALKSERDALAAQLAEARGLLAEAHPIVDQFAYENPTWGDGERTQDPFGATALRGKLSTFLAPPSDRGAEGES